MVIMKTKLLKSISLENRMPKLLTRIRSRFCWYVFVALMFGFLISPQAHAQVGMGGTNVLANPGFESGTNGWTLYQPGSTTATQVVSTNSTYLNSGACGSDPTA